MDMQEFEPKTLIEAMRYFSNPENCERFVEEMRWPDGVACPFCESKNIGRIASRKLYQCKGCRRQFSLKRGTIFEDSPISLDKWLGAMWLIANCKNGISSYEIGRDLGITQKSAWFMMHRIRAAMQDDDDGKLGGEVEVDETFVGGKAINMHKARRAAKLKGATGHFGKTAVMGLLERRGKVRTKVVRNTRRETLDPLVRKQVVPGSTVYTDALASYAKLDDEYIHGVIDHAIAYVNGKVHTNGMENFWSLLKRMIKGTYISVEAFHLFRYLDEETFRFNTRKTSDSARFCKTLTKISGKRLTYATLCGMTPVE